MNVYITTTTPIGGKCARWAINNPLSGVSIVSEMDACDIFFSIFYNKLLSVEFIARRKKCFNFHGGLLPQYRGSGTINWAIINGENETGVTLHEVDAQIDHGAIVAINKIPIQPHDTAKDLYDKMEVEIFDLFRKWYKDLVTFHYSATPQDHSKARVYSRTDLQMAKDLSRFARAFEFPGKENAFFINRSGEKIYLKFDN